MRSIWLVTAVSLLTLAGPVVSTGAGRGAVLRRQDTESNDSPPSTAPPARPSSQASIQPSSEPSSAPPSATSQPASQSENSGSGTASPTGGVGGTSARSTRASSTRGSPSTLSGVVIGASATPISNSTYNGTITPEVHIDGLPIHPSVTPAIAVAGAILMVSGAFYTLIGIKTPRLHIFFSTAYLFSLAVTVLIEYVMHPPISNGIQGAYFVAACATGAVFGAVAIVFADVTEGLGCFLGGFCLSMWFLVLKPGGLISTTAGKAIFIACFTVGTFALYLSHYTRPYGIIGSTSFAGATVVILGVDCFSRAGLKEFWLYLWNLNNGLFPLNYAGPYPITRGIRVEIAGIVFIFLLGVMSQIKVWKIVKERREVRAAEQRRKDEERDKAEDALGRQLEAENEQERALWDEVYGDKNKAKVSQLDSGIGTDAPTSTHKSSMSIVEVQGMEMQDLSDSRSLAPQGGKITVHVAQDEILEAPESAGPPSPKSAKRASGGSSIVESQDPDVISTRAPSVKAAETKAKRQTPTPDVDPSLTLKATPKPRFVPLPFTVPSETPGHRQDNDDASSVATFAASDHLPDRLSKALSGASIMRKVSGRSHKRQSNSTPGISQEALIVPHVDDDRASSIAATLDGVSDKAGSDVDFNSRRNSVAVDEQAPAPASDPQDSVPAAEPQNQIVMEHGGIQDESTAATRAPNPAGTEPHIVSDEPTQPAKSQKAASVASESAQLPVNGRAESVTTVEVPESPITRTTLARDLPRGASKIEMAYRTNEWAKHLDRADAPETEEIQIPETQAALSRQAEESAAPVNVRALQQTALTAEPAPEIVPIVKPTDNKSQKPSVNRSVSAEETSNNPYRSQQPSRLSRSDSPQNQLAKNLERQPSLVSLVSSNGSQEDSPGQSLSKTRGNQSTLTIPRGLRSSSSPMVASPLASSPIQEDVEATFPPKFTPSASHLMSQRDNLIRNKPSSTSLLLRSASAGSMNRMSTFNIPNNSTAALQESAEDDEDSMPLAQRKSMLQRNSSRTSIIQRTLSSGALTPAAAGSRLSLVPQTTATFVDNNPYHQPQAGPPIANPNPPHVSRPHQSQDPTAITSWRASLAQLPYTAEQQQAIEIERRRSQLMAEKNAQKRTKAVEAGQKEQRDSVLGREMRRGSLLDAHREAMRRMQGQVNEKMKN